MQCYGTIGCMICTYYYESFMNKAKMRQPELLGIDWVRRTLKNPIACFDMFRMSRPLFESLHNLLESSCGLKSSDKMPSVEALAMFLWMVGAPQSIRQADNRFERSKETISRKFEEVLHSLYKLSADIIKPKDPQFRTVHPRLQAPRFAPYFDNCTGAIDGTHVPAVVPASKVLQFVSRKGYNSQNVLAICDFDMRFTFVVAGWPGSVHDMRVFMMPYANMVTSFHIYHQRNSILLTRDILIGRVILRRTKGPNIIYLSINKGQDQRGKRRYSIMLIHHFEMSSSILLGF